MTQLSATYASLPDHFYARHEAQASKQPTMLLYNEALAAELGLSLTPEEALAAFSGQQQLPGSQPLAMAYAGHQFGQFVPQLGDGRALLLGEVETADGRLLDVQLKGSGRTRFSRGGDGRAALGPVLREYLISEAMHALRIPTTRALAAVATGEPVYRDTMLPGAILTRVASSHIRVGTFQYFAARDDRSAVQTLADYVIERHYPELKASDQPYLDLISAVQERQIHLVTRWLMVGFVHGVMNTDNTAIAGETIDYGPCAFMDAYDPTTVFSSIDHAGRYAYLSQPSMAHWNIARFAETLLELLDPDSDRALTLANGVIEAFPAAFHEVWLRGMGQKLGLTDASEADRPLIQDLLTLAQEAGADYTVLFRDLAPAADGDVPERLRTVMGSVEPRFTEWLERWRKRLADPAAAAAAMNEMNPAVIPRNHQVEAALSAAHDNDLEPFKQLQAALANPFEVPAAHPELAEAPAAPAPYVTFCGT
ncbi:MAG: YdiU family protein [Pseudomonadota bacterium]